MSRRTGQNGNVYQPAYPGKWCSTAPCYGRYWIDVPGAARKRTTVSLGVCATRSIARQRLREHLDREGVNSKLSFHQNTAPATTFRQQAEHWLASLAKRRRKPVKPATIRIWRLALDKWLLPNLGDKILADIGNAALKGVVEKMAEAGLSPMSIRTYSCVVKMVLASAVNTEGDQIYPRKWNHAFIGLPLVDPTQQHRPTVKRSELEGILARLSPRYALLVATLAGTGLRVGEVLGLKISDLSPDCCILAVKRSIWYGREQSPKTPNAIRVVDVPEELARVLRERCAGASGYLFATRDGKPLQQRNLRRILHKAGAKCGFHAFRRYRAAVLRRARVPEDLIGLWLGHARNLTDTYALQLREDVGFRQHWCNVAGLMFGLQMGYKFDETQRQEVPVTA